jgi:hypothetical protein
MRRASNLIEAYNNFVGTPLRTEEEFRSFYVKRPKLMPSPIEELKDRIENSRTAEKYLFLGFRGCGKSTELNRLRSMMAQKDFLIIMYSIRDKLDVSDFDFKDFFASMALEIYDVAEKEGVKLKEEIRDDFLDFMMNITKVSEDEVTKYRGLGISFSNFIMLKLGTEAKTRESVRRELETKISDLIRRLNWLIEDVQIKSKKKVLVMVDDLDKLTRGQQSEDFFYKNYGLLTQPSCFIIYTFPIPLAFHPFYENVRHAFDDDVILAHFPTKDRDGNVVKENLDFFKQIVENRMDVGLIEEKALEKAIFNTGKTSEFISIIRNATIKAYLNGGRKIKEVEVEECLEKFRRAYDRTLTESHKKRLLEIFDKKEARDKDANDSVSRDLLFTLTAVEYEDEKGRWCDVDPLLAPLVEKWKIQSRT